MSTKRGMELRISADDEDVVYLKLPDHPGGVPGIVKKTVRLHDVLGDYSGPDLYFDFDENNMLIGVEILV
jgi:hypothetical protein